MSKLMHIRIEELDVPELDLYARLSEVQLKRYYEPAPGLFIAESPKVIRRALEAGYEPVSVLAEDRQYEMVEALFQGRILPGDEAGRVLDENNALQRTAGKGSGAVSERPHGSGIRKQSEYGTVPVYTAEEQVLINLTGYYLTSGVLSVFRRKKLLGLRELLSEAPPDEDVKSLPGLRELLCEAPSGEEMNKTPAMREKFCEAPSGEGVKSLPDLRGEHAGLDRGIRRIAVLEHVVNPTNLGAIVRSAAALGMDAVLFTPDCCDPLYRRAIRVSMGNIFQIPWTFTGDDPDEWYQSGVRTLKDLGFYTTAMALREHSSAVDDPKFAKQEKLAVILGTEGEGLAKTTIEACDDAIMIPMAHAVDSLNVGAAAAIAFWNLGVRTPGEI